MRQGLFAQLIPKLRLSDGKSIASGENWQFWQALEDRAFGEPERLYLLYFDSSANWSTLRQAIDESRKKAALRDKRLFCVVQNSCDLAKDLTRLKKETGATNTYTVRQLLTQSISSRLGEVGTEDSDRLFVDPDLQAIDAERTPQNGLVKTIHTLSGWLKDDSNVGPSTTVVDRMRAEAIRAFDSGST
jgi:hypothetical protein